MSTSKGTAQSETFPAERLRMTKPIYFATHDIVFTLAMYASARREKDRSCSGEKIMPVTRGKRIRASRAHYEAKWSYCLARGSCFIASTLTPLTLNAAINEAVEVFVAREGREDLPLFPELLAERLQQREKPAAADAVLHLRARGTLPSVSELAGEKTVAGRRSSEQRGGCGGPTPDSRLQ